MLSQKIKQARLAAGLSLDDCVDRLKSKTFSISKPALSQYENGKRSPNAKVLKMLGELFSVPPTWFLGTQPDFSITWYAYRAQATLGTKKRDSIEAYASHIAEKNGNRSQDNFLNIAYVQAHQVFSFDMCKQLFLIVT